MIPEIKIARGSPSVFANKPILNEPIGIMPKKDRVYKAETRPRMRSSTRVCTRVFPMVVNSMNPVPIPTMNSREMGTLVTKDQPISMSGSRKLPMVRIRPFMRIFPSEAMLKAAIREPTPRADCRYPLVAESPLSTCTAQAGSSAIKPMPINAVKATMIKSTPNGSMLACI